MNIKKKYFIYAVLPLIVVAALSAGSAWARGWFGGLGNISPDEIASRQQTMFENEAQILGISVDEVKEAWAEGKSFKQIMEEKGIGEEQVRARMRELRLQQMKSYLQTLVDKGTITQTQADKRLQVMQEQFENGKIGKIGRGFRGFGFHGMMW